MSICVSRESLRVRLVNVRFSGNCLINSDGDRGDRNEIERSSTGISMLDFLCEYFMNQLCESGSFIFIFFFFIISYFILFVFDLQKGKMVLEECPRNSVCAYPCGLSHCDPPCLTGAGEKSPVLLLCSINLS